MLGKPAASLDLHQARLLHVSLPSVLRIWTGFIRWGGRVVISAAENSGVGIGYSYIVSVGLFRSRIVANSPHPQGARSEAGVPTVEVTPA